MKTCDVNGCSATGRWYPVVLLFAGYEHGAHPPARCSFELAHCDEHKASITVNDVLTDEGFESIANDIERMGKMRPVQSRCRIEWVLRS